MTSLSTVQVIAELREERDWYRDWWYRGKDIAIDSLTSMGYPSNEAKRIAKRMYDEICIEEGV